jgi:hypothetical protein
VPRLPARLFYLIGRIVDRNSAWESVARFLEAHRGAYRAFSTGERLTKEALFGCLMCGQCALPITAYVCPMTCPKQLRNGPCGGVRADGGCEVHPGLQCVWVAAYQRARECGREGDLLLLQRPVDQQRHGESSWVNFWRGRDEAIAATVSGGGRLPPLLAPVAGDDGRASAK